MADVTTKKCDGCGRLRVNDSNHWLQATIGRLGIFVGPLDGQIGLMHSLAKDVKHFCGRQCVTSWFVSALEKVEWKTETLQIADYFEKHK